MLMEDFIAENREALDAAILSVVPGYPLDDDDREEWIANDEGLYNWARRSGVDV